MCTSVEWDAPVASMWADPRTCQSPTTIRLRVGLQRERYLQTKTVRRGAIKHWKKKKILSSSQKKDTKKTFVYLLEDIISLLEKWDHFLTCLNKPKLWTKWSLFKTGCSSWSLVCIKKKLSLGPCGCCYGFCIQTTTCSLHGLKWVTPCLYESQFLPLGWVQSSL